MKRLRTALGAGTLALSLALTNVPGVAHAQVTQPFSTGFQLQNLGSSDATVSIAFYPEDNGTASLTFEATVAGNGQVTYALLDGSGNGGVGPNLGENFAGSAVVSSDQKVAAIVNLVSTGLGLDFGGEAYVGASSGSEEVSIPLLFKDYYFYNTFFNVQNVGTESTTVTVTYTDGTVEDAVTIPAGASHRFDQAANTDLPAGFNGGATVSAPGGEIAAVAVEVGPDQVLVYNGFAAGAAFPVMPLINTHNYNFMTGIAIQNRGDVDTVVTVTYTPSSSATGDACTEQQTIKAKSVTYFANEAFSAKGTGYEGEENCTDNETFVGAAEVTENSTEQELVAIINQTNNVSHKGGTYTAFDPAVGSQTVVYPLIQANYYGFSTGLSMMNVGDVDTTIECSFSGTDVTQTSETLEPGEVYTVNQGGTLPDGYNGSGTCTAAASGAEIVGIANQVAPAWKVDGVDTDAFFVYEE